MIQLKLQDLFECVYKCIACSVSYSTNKILFILFDSIDFKVSFFHSKVNSHIFLFLMWCASNKSKQSTPLSKGAASTPNDYNDVQTERRSFLPIVLEATNRNSAQRGNTSTMFENYSYYIENYIGGHFDLKGSYCMQARSYMMKQDAPAWRFLRFIVQQRMDVVYTE